MHADVVVRWIPIAIQLNNRESNDQLKQIGAILGLVMIVFLSTTVMGNSSNCEMDRAESTAVVTADKRIEAVDNFEKLLDNSIKTIRMDDGYDNLILFVHGRGQHPCHAFNKALLTELEYDYSAKIIMFHWPSWNGALAFPDENARRSADVRNLP
jgi:hypothetical protein